MSTNEMSAKIRELKELEQLIAQCEAEAEAIKDIPPIIADGRQERNRYATERHILNLIAKRSSIPLTALRERRRNGARL